MMTEQHLTFRTNLSVAASAAACVRLLSWLSALNFAIDFASPSFVIRHSSFVVGRWSFVVRRSSFVVRRSSFVVRRSSFVERTVRSLSIKVQRTDRRTDERAHHRHASRVIPVEGGFLRRVPALWLQYSSSAFHAKRRFVLAFASHNAYSRIAVRAFCRMTGGKLRQNSTRLRYSTVFSRNPR